MNMFPSPSETKEDKEVVDAATIDGFTAGSMVLAPMLGALALAMRNPTFVKSTNWAGRTALVAMPPAFAVVFVGDQSLHHRIRSKAGETQYHQETVEWAEEHYKDTVQKQMALNKENYSEQEKEQHLLALYRQSVEESGVKIVPSLAWYHNAANYVSSNPFKVLAAVTIPSVGLIFYGRTGKEHLQFSIKILHTRIFGQFTAVALVLGIMGFKDYMDRNGRYITEAEADRRVEEMSKIRQRLVARIDEEAKLQLEQRQRYEAAHTAAVARKENKKKQVRNNGKKQEAMLVTSEATVAAVN